MKIEIKHVGVGYYWQYSIKSNKGYWRGGYSEYFETRAEAIADARAFVEVAKQGFEVEEGA